MLCTMLHVDIKELAEMYKSTCRSTKPEKGKVQINDPRKMTVMCFLIIIIIILIKHRLY